MCVLSLPFAGLCYKRIFTRSICFQLVFSVFCNLLLNDCFFLVLYLQKVDPELIFTKQERIGKGSFGEVFKGVDNRTQQVSNRAPATSFFKASDEVLKQDKLSHGLPQEEKFSTLLRKTKLFFSATIPKGFCD